MRHPALAFTSVLLWSACAGLTPLTFAPDDSPDDSPDMRTEYTLDARFYARDLGSTRDLAIGVGDAAETPIAGDLASRPDLAPAPDLARAPADLTSNVDLAARPDLAVARDLSTAPDLADPVCLLDAECAAGQFCDAGRCAWQLCSPDAAWCEGAVLAQCASNGGSVARREDCVNGCSNGQCIPTRRLYLELEPGAWPACAMPVIVVFGANGQPISSLPGRALDIPIPAGWAGWAVATLRCDQPPAWLEDLTPPFGTAREAGFRSVRVDGDELSQLRMVFIDRWSPDQGLKLLVPLDVHLRGTGPTDRRIGIRYWSPFAGQTTRIEVSGTFAPGNVVVKDLCPPVFNVDYLGCSIPAPIGWTTLTLSFHLTSRNGEAWSCQEDFCGTGLYGEMGRLEVREDGFPVARELVGNGMGCGCSTRFRKDNPDACAPFFVRFPAGTIATRLSHWPVAGPSMRDEQVTAAGGLLRSLIGACAATVEYPDRWPSVVRGDFPAGAPTGTVYFTHPNLARPAGLCALNRATGAYGTAHDGWCP